MAFSGIFPVFIVMILFMSVGKQFVYSVITDVRLVGGPTSNKGTVEISLDSEAWKTTCGLNLDFSDAIVICRQLGFTGASRAIRDTPYEQNSTLITGLNCNGDEADLSECLLLPVHCSSAVAGAASCHGEGYLGCFVDRPVDRVFPGDSLVVDRDMTIPYCINFCNESNSANFTYAGVENGNECFCGVASDNYTRHDEVGSESHMYCQIPCAGDPTESCGGSGHIAVFRIFQSPPTTVADTSPTTTTPTPSNFASTSGQLDVNTVFQSTPPPTTVADMSQTTTTNTTTTPTPSTFASISGQLDVNTVFRSTPPPTTVADTSSTFATTSGQLEVNTEVASTLAVGILLAFVTLYGIIITLMYLHLRRSNIALKQSVSDRVGQELDPYTSLDATTMKQPAYEDIKATRHENRGHTNAIEGVEYGYQTIVEQTARVKKSNLGVADENTEPEYELPIEK